MSRKLKRIATTPGYAMYLRTSDAEVQAPERSQDAQRRDIHQRLVNHYDLPLVEEYVDNYTGTSADRKNYQRMLKDVRLGKVSHVFAAVPDRFGRDDVEALRAIDEMSSLGIVVRFASHPDLILEMKMTGFISIFYSAWLSANLLSSLGAVKEECFPNYPRADGLWRAPDGYVNKEIKLTELDGASPEELLRHARYKRWIEKDPEQSKIWREAWDMLLEDRMSLTQICDALASRGYRLKDGTPFVRRASRGEIRHNVQALSRAFNNWLYAGWIVVDNEWAKIAPKTVRAEWEPIVTTDEFERGLAILARHRRTPIAKKKHFYLLQGLLYLEAWEGYYEKLRCSKPNANRRRGGVPYYSVPNCEVYFLCHTIDGQIAEHMGLIQVDPTLLPPLHRAYTSNVHFYSSSLHREPVALTNALERLEKKEVNLWRAFTDHGMRAAIYEKLAQELEEERARIEFAFKAIQQENKECIAT